MPTYRYVCKSCDHAFEEFQSITADALVSCPSCRESALKRLIGAGGGVIFKGSGFYVNDYARSGSSSPRSSGADGASTSNGNSEGDSGSGDSSTSSSGDSSTDKSCGSCGTTGPDVCD